MKRLLTILLITVLACVVHADTVILWFVDDPDVQEIGGDSVKISDLVSRGENAGLQAEYVRMSVTGDTISGSDYLYLSYDPSEWIYTDTDLYLDGDSMGAGPAFANVSSYISSEGSYDSSLSFMIEIGNYNDQGDWITMAVSQVMTIDSLKEGDHIFSDELHYQGSTDWSGGSYSVPEPSSGLLILMGAGLLALRRRRRAA